jgi:hypothetical protein
LSASPTTNRYSIEIKNVAGKPLVFINADWTDDEARAAVAQIIRLASRPDESYSTQPAGAQLCVGFPPLEWRLLEEGEAHAPIA